MTTADGTTAVCPVDPTLHLYPEAFAFGGEALEPIYEIPDGGPASPPPALGRRHQLVLCQPITHKPLAQLNSFEVSDWGDDFGPGNSVTGTASLSDPAWLLVGARTTTYRGRKVGVPDAKGLEVMFGVDGMLAASGVLQQPIPLGDGQVQLTVSSPEAVLDERALGETEQKDYYRGLGSFPTTDLTGWTFDANLEHTWEVAQPWQGTRSLKVKCTSTAGGWVYGPWVNIPGQDGFVRHPVASAMVRSATAAEGIVAACWVELPDGTPVRQDYTLANASSADSSTTGWQGPIAGRGWLTPAPIDHRVRAGIHIPGGNQWVTIDFVRLQWPTLTGYPTQKDLSLYPLRILRDYQYRPGGSPEGIHGELVSLTGKTERLSWAHQDDHPAWEAITSITERDDGPDVWITPGWVMKVAKRRGRDRRDVALNADSMIRATVTIDPGSEVDEFRALTDLGSGPTRIVHGIDQPRRRHRRRIRRLVQAPVGLTYGAGRAWTAGQAEWAAREPMAFEADVTYEFGLRLNVGDGVLFAWADGNVAWWGPVRIGSRRFKPGEGICTITGGTDPKVDL